MRSLSILFAMTLALPALAAADCGRQTSTHAINACAQQEFDVADHALNAEYKKLRARLAAPDKERLLAEQRAWIKGRDPQCREDLEADQGGTIWTSLYLECQAQATRDRTAQLRHWISKK